MKKQNVHWIEFIYFPIIFFSPFVLNILFSLISNLLNINIFNSFGQKNLAIISDCIINLFIIILFIFLSNDFYKQVKHGLDFLKSNWKVLLILLISFKILFELLNTLLTNFNNKLNLESTENQNQLLQWITDPTSIIMAIIIFLSIVIIGPAAEEILYRHLIIGELRKIFPYQLMAIISILIFSFMHIQSAKSVTEIFLYIILAIPIVAVYIKSNCNVIVSIVSHIFINLTSYIYILLIQ